jgi:hypothetical protein
MAKLLLGKKKELEEMDLRYIAAASIEQAHSVMGPSARM